MSNNENNSLNFSSFDDKNEVQNIKNTKVSEVKATEKSGFFSKMIKNKKSLTVTVCITLIAALFLAFTVILISGINKAPDEDEEEGSKKNNSSAKTTYSTNSFEYKTKLSADVRNALNTTSKEYLMLVNKKKPLGADYVPENLVTVDSSICTKESQLVKNAAIAAEALVAEMIAEGFTDIKITSAYRSYSRQDQLFEGYIATEMSKNPSLTREEAENIVLGYSAKAGYSEHQSGLCIDLINTEKMLDLVNFGTETPNSPYDLGFAELDEYEWLLENAHKFGFVLRYPENKTGKTGYNYESWHYRFVGVDAATKMYKKGITLEEYLD